MQVFRSIDDFTSDKKTVVTIGTFDGVHVGHRKIIDRIIDDSSQSESVILTFFPHPRMILHGSDSITLLNTMDEKIDLLENYGVDNLIIHPFDDTFSKMTAERFVREILVERLNLKKIVIGHDHRFGVNRTAGIDDLIRFGKIFDFEVEQIPVQEINDVSVSSTKIRDAISNGNMPFANNFLGYDYFITGMVADGNRLGRTIGFPTANIKIAEVYKLIPKIGVYAVRSEIDGKSVGGMMNIGYKPTVGGNAISIEVYYFDFEADLYGKSLRVHIIERIRDEIKFDSVDSLKKQLTIDETSARNILERG